MYTISGGLGIIGLHCRLYIYIVYIYIYIVELWRSANPKEVAPRIPIPLSDKNIDVTVTLCCRNVPRIIAPYNKIMFQGELC